MLTQRVGQDDTILEMGYSPLSEPHNGGGLSTFICIRYDIHQVDFGKNLKNFNTPLHVLAGMTHRTFITWVGEKRDKEIKFIII